MLEDACIGKGDASCRLIGRTREAWGSAHDADLRFFERRHLKESLDISLQHVIETLKETERKLLEHKRALIRVVREVEEPLGIVARSPRMAHLVDIARRVAKVDSTVLVTGESGAGKERIAQNRSARRGRSSLSTAGRSASRF